MSPSSVGLAGSGDTATSPVASACWVKSTAVSVGLPDTHGIPLSFMHIHTNAEQTAGDIPWAGSRWRRVGEPAEICGLV